MKKIITPVFVAIFCFYSNTSFAESAETSTREVRTSAFWHLAALPVYFFLELNLHEGSHAVAGILTGADIVSYEPYPHYVENIDGSRNFVFGCVRTDWGGIPSDSVGVYAFISPYIAQTSAFIVSDLLLSFVPQIRDSLIFGPMVYLAGMVMPWFDFVINLNSRSDSGDFAIVADFLNTRRVGAWIIGNFLAGIGLWRLIAQGIEVFSEVIGERDESRESAIRFMATPVFGEFNGISVGLQM